MIVEKQTIRTALQNARDKGATQDQAIASVAQSTGLEPDTVRAVARECTACRAHAALERSRAIHGNTGMAVRRAAQELGMCERELALAAAEHAQTLACDLVEG